ncbi:MAG TPA: SDR family oxidoreductase [Chitinophagales bacterium]|nr:SDR family oxidoreductase [Chitinophagales bacterium]
MTPKNKIALVTGGSRGLGKDMALRLAEKGSDIIITYQSNKDMAAEVVRSIESSGRKAAALQYDAADFKSLDGFLQEVKELLQSKWKALHFDFLINNAGIGATIPFAQVSEDDFDRFLNIHFKSIYFLTQRALPMINDGGRIINISTGTTRFCVPGYSVYASMKGAIETFTRYLAREAGPRGITANVLAPGPIETDFNNAALRSNPDRKATMATLTALGRVGQASDIGGIVALLCSEDAGWITGQRIEASGGINL